MNGSIGERGGGTSMPIPRSPPVTPTAVIIGLVLMFCNCFSVYATLAYKPWRSREQDRL